MSCGGSEGRDVTEILQIDCDEGYIRRMPRMLDRSQWGAYSVEAAATLSDGTHKLREASFDAVVLELELPDSEGIEALFRVKQLRPQLPALVYSGIQENDVGNRVIREGAQDFLPKDTTTSFQLSRALAHAIERQKLINRAARLQKELVGSERDRAVVETARAAAREIEPSLRSLDVELEQMESNEDVHEIIRRIEAVRNTLDQLFESVERLDRVYRYVAETSGEEGRKVNLNAATLG